ncbi:MAG: M48 family metalloprotease [Pseudomonadota bacterium]|nr:M48 family metalloprotease [Pseudomonadota bacterium]
MRRVIGLLSGCILLSVLTACAVNPVTGQNELNIISTEQEVSLGAQNYVPAQQMQGGLYKVDPRVGAYVQEVGQKLAAVSDRPLPYEFVVLNNSIPNAWAMPGGKLAVNRGLLTELNNEAELAAVLGHEITHAAARHSAQQMQRALLLQAGVMAVAAAAGSADDRYGPLAVGTAALAASVLNQRYSREAELEADYYGMAYMARAGYDPSAAVTLQETFVRLSEGRQTGWLDGLLASHPPSAERVAQNRLRAQQLGIRGELNPERYRDRIATLLKDQPAYEAYDQAVEALGEKNVEKAQTLVAQAVKAQPREALFHGLQGYLALQQSRPSEALADYERALALDGGYYQHYVGAGLAAKALKRDAPAMQYLEKSLTLLPTATAHNALGELALARGDRGRAIEHLRIAAQSDSPVGKQARDTLSRMGVPIAAP